jgi:hypothetical protein
MAVLHPYAAGPVEYKPWHDEMATGNTGATHYSNILLRFSAYAQLP